MKRALLFAIVLSASVSVRCTQPAPTAQAQAQAQAPKYEVKVNPDEILSITYNDELMLEAKLAYQTKDPDFMVLFDRFKKHVDDNFLNSTEAPRYITDRENRIAPPSGDMRDQMTLSPYWWPDPDSEDGLPYIRHDGIRNVEDIARYSSGSPTSGSDYLAFMYFLTDDERYAERAAAILRAWYIDPEKGVNPNNIYAQFVPGMERIRGKGSGSAPRAVNTAKLIEPSQAWTEQDEADMQDWAKAFLYWLEYSTHGQEEHRSCNNHATWYEANRQAITLYTKDYDHLAKIIREDLFPHLSAQIGPDSTMTQEIMRTLGLHYTTYNLSALTISSIVAHKIGIDDIWSHTGENGRGMLWGVDYVIPYWLAPEKWPYMQIRALSDKDMAFTLHQVGSRTGTEKYFTIAEQIGFELDDNAVPNMNQLLYYKLRK